MKISLVKQLNGTFKLAYDSDFEIAKKIKAGYIIEYQFKQVRNVKFHRLFFSLLNLVFDNQEIYTNLDHLRHDLTVDAGYYDLTYNFNGEEVKRPKSISFSSMDETEFKKLYSDVLDSILRNFKWSQKDIEENLINYF